MIKNKLVISTYYACKGLERKVVVLFGFREELHVRQSGGRTPRLVLERVIRGPDKVLGEADHSTPQRGPLT
jgi:hypothetical protein